MRRAVVIGAGPAGLIAAETLARGGADVTVCDAMPSPGRKLLMAGRGGLNLTHSEPLDVFLTRYGAAADRLAPAIRAFPPAALIAWAESLGQDVFTGSSGRVFPRAMKASPLLRAWLARLRDLGVDMRMRTRWRGWSADGALRFCDADGSEQFVDARAVVLALGGGSWAKLGSDGAWMPFLAQRGVAMAPLKPANCGFETPWSEHFRARFAGSPVKNAALVFAGRASRGEFAIAGYGVEGGAIYARAAELRDAIARDGAAALQLDLKPDLDAATVVARLARRRAGETTSSRLRRTLGLAPVAVALLRDSGPLPQDDAALARRIKDVTLRLVAPAPMARAISTAGGVTFSDVDDAFQLRAMPGVFVAGEMIDWEAPTGGYLLQACFATGVAAARGALERLKTAK